MNTTYYKIAYRKKNTGSIIDDTQTPFVALKNSWRYWVADPFVISRMGKTYIFAELYDYLRRKGCIGYCELLPDGSQSKWKAVLKEKYHMAYPQPIEHNGDVYLIPESSFGKVLCAYKAVSFPDKWEKAYVLASGTGLTDTTFVSDSDKVYAFACSTEDPTDEILRMFELSDNGQLEETAMSPVVDDVSCARPAGKFFNLDGKLYRPSQDCTDSYGNKLNILEVDTDFRTYYKETNVRKISVDDLTILNVDAPERIHTYNSNGEYEVVDVFAKNKNILNFVGRAAAVVIRKVLGSLLRR